MTLPPTAKRTTLSWWPYSPSEVRIQAGTARHANALRQLRGFRQVVWPVTGPYAAVFQGTMTPNEAKQYVQRRLTLEQSAAFSE